MKKCKIVVTFDCEYDPERFTPKVETPKDLAGICDVATFAEIRLCDYRQPDDFKSQ